MENLNSLKLDQPNIRFDNLFKQFKPTLDLLSELNVRFMIAGGCIRDFFTGTKLSDIDIFTPNEASLLRILNKFSELDAKVILNNDRVVKLEYNNIEYDIIKLHFSNAESLIKDFDFTVCQFAIDHTNTFYYVDEAFMDLTKKQLMVYDLHYPESTMIRVRKYMMKGYRICHEELTKIILAIRNQGILLENKNSDKIESIIPHPIHIKTYKSEFYKEDKYSDIQSLQANRSVVPDELLENLGFDIQHLNVESELSQQSYIFYGID